MATAQLAAGTRLDGFEILERIGYGAFSDVYRARDPAGREVVLKCPHEVMLGDSGAFDRFRREIEIADRLDHPGIQRSLDTHARRSRPYLVLEYVPGQTLRKILWEGGPMRVERAVDITCQLADAMSYAHSRGVIHRDLKPENMLLESSGRLAVTDFGIALMEGARRITYRWFSAEMGTPDYMAPEQIQGKRGDARSDIYAIGVVFYEMLSGRVPWKGDEALSIMSQKLVGRPADLTRVAPGVPGQLVLIVARCIRRAPSERYQTAAGLLHDLEHWPDLDRSLFCFPIEKQMKGSTEMGLWMLIGGICAGFVAFSAAAVLLYHMVTAAHG